MAKITKTNRVIIGSPIPLGTSGSVLFMDANGKLAQDNANFFFDDTNNRVGIGTSTPSNKLSVNGGVNLISSTPSTTSEVLYNSSTDLIWDDNILATVSTNTFEIWSLDDLPTAVNGVITLTVDGMYRFMTPMTFTDRIELAQDVVVLFEQVQGWTNVITYSGSDTFITSLGGNTTRFFHFVLLLTGDNANIVDVTDGSVGFDSSAFIGVGDNIGLGTVSGAVSSYAQSARFICKETDFLDFERGFSITNSSSITLHQSFLRINAASTDTIFDLSGGLQRVDVLGLNLHTGTDSSLFTIDPAIPETAAVTIGRVNHSSVEENEMFNTTITKSGTFSAVADASVPAEAITSVTDSSGVARFNFTAPPTLFVNQEVIISGFTINTAYNNTHIITSTGAGWFEVSNIPFGTNETGSFLSNSVTMTETATTVANGDSIKVDTDYATDYDNGSLVYNKQTNSFQVNKTWTETHSGTWDNGGIDESDPRILAFFNPGKKDSHNLAFANVNNNSTANGTIVNNTFTDMVFGPDIDNALVEGSTTERWKLIDPVNGTLEFTGNEHFSGNIAYGVSAQSAGSALEFRYKWVHDVGAGFVDLEDIVEAANEIKEPTSATFSVTPLNAVKGDKIKPQITRSTGSSGITITHFQVNVQ